MLFVQQFAPGTNTFVGLINLTKMYGSSVALMFVDADGTKRTGVALPFVNNQYGRRWTSSRPDFGDWEEFLKLTDLIPIRGHHKGTYYFVLHDLANREFNIPFLEVEWQSTGRAITDYHCSTSELTRLVLNSLW
jgi:hypothetical protein